MLQTTLPPSSKTITRAKALRAVQTPMEKVLWKKLRAERFHGLKFRRQAPLGPYVVDFLCIEHHLILEMDGDIHYETEALEHDRRRDVYLRAKGFCLLRFSNKRVRENIEGVLMAIGRACGIPYN